MATKTEICNLAISHLGIGKEIANVDSENSQEANACKRFFDVAKESTLKDISWSFATEYQTLNLIEESPDDEWSFSYRYPVDCLSIRRILSGNRNDTRDSRIPFKLLKDSSGKLIFCDRQDAVIEYTQNVKDTSFFTSEFVMALSFRLASYIAPRLTKGDPFKIKQDMLGQYDIELNIARKQASNEETNEQLPESEFIRTRS